MYVMDKHSVREMRIAIALGIGIGLMLAINFGIAWYFGATIGGIAGMFAYRPKEAWEIVCRVPAWRWNWNPALPAGSCKVFMVWTFKVMFFLCYTLSLFAVAVISLGFCEPMKVYGVFPGYYEKFPPAPTWKNDMELVGILGWATFLCYVLQIGLYNTRKKSSGAWIFPLSRVFGVFPTFFFNRLNESNETKGGFIWLVAPFFFVLAPVVVAMFAIAAIVVMLDIAISAILALAGNERLTIFVGVFLGTAIGCLVYRTANLPPIVIIPGMMMVGGYYGPLLYVVRQKIVAFFHSAEQKVVPISIR